LQRHSAPVRPLPYLRIQGQESLDLLLDQMLPNCFFMMRSGEDGKP
jgi:hypothetical protein